jgi:hypothetical protein
MIFTLFLSFISLVSIIPLLSVPMLFSTEDSLSRPNTYITSFSVISWFLISLTFTVLNWIALFSSYTPPSPFYLALSFIAFILLLGISSALSSDTST